MKEVKWKRLMALGLVTVLTVGLCGCGKDKKQEENNSLSKENVYHVQEMTLPKFYEGDNGNLNFYGTAYVDGKVNVLVQVYDYNNYSDQGDFRLLTMNADGSDMNIIPLEVPAASNEENFGEEVDVSEGTFEPAEGEEGTEDGYYDENNGGNTWEYTGYSSFVITNSGKIYGIKNHNFEDYSNPENYISNNDYYLCSWNSDGSLAWEKELTEVKSSQDEWMNIYSMAEGNDGKLYLLISGEEYSKIAIDADGTVGKKTKLSDAAAACFRSVDRYMTNPDGSATIIYRDENDWTKVFCAKYDIVTDAVTESKEIASSIMNNWDYNIMIPGKNADLVYTGSNGIYQYNLGDETPTMKMNYVNSDLYINTLQGMVETGDESFIAIYTENNEWNTWKAGVFTYVKPEDIVDKTVLVVAGQWINYDLKQRVIDYNKSSDKYRIVIKDYSEYNTYDDYNAGVTKLNNDIISGGMPDILYTSNLPMDNYISKGLVADIGKLIEKDEELSNVEFMQNVFDAYSRDGKLYYIVPQFEVYTVIAKKALVGNRTSWTMDEMKQVLAGLDGATAFGTEVTRTEFMNMVMRYCGSQFLDVATGKCSFNSDAFISMMEYAKELPDEIDYGTMDDGYWDTYWQNYQSQYRDNRTLMMQANLYNFPWMAQTINGNFGEDIAFIGFPTDNGKGAYLSCYDTYALSAKSKNLDGAWDFMRYYLTDEYQDSVGYLPVKKSTFMEKSKEAMERPYWTDENGEKQYYDNTMYINGEEIVVPPLSQSQLDEVIAYIESVNTTYDYNENVMNIISEEIEAYFSGQKSAKDVADTIQKRAQIYVDENR